MAKILVLHAHPRPDRSVANAAMSVMSQRHPAVTFVDLYAAYPDFEINIDLEQQRLVEHDVIIWEHPLYWYSTPAILKEWQDLVLEHGFAYGTAGTALEGKLFLNVLSVGASQDAYTEQGFNQHSVRDLLMPIEQMAITCYMLFLPPLVLYGAGHAAEESRLAPHQQAYGDALDLLAAGKLDVSKARALQTFNEVLRAQAAGSPL